VHGTDASVKLIRCYIKLWSTLDVVSCNQNLGVFRKLR
jgi:hypothetical protein